MDRACVYAAVAIGAILHTYRTSDISAVSPDFFGTENIRRHKKWLLEKVESRFRNLMVIPGDSGRQPVGRPTEYQFAFVNKSLVTLAPHVPGHPTSCSAVTNLLEEYFSYDSERAEAERVHVVLNTDCGGWARLVEEYNRLQNDSAGRPLEDPSEKLRLPLFDYGFIGPPDGSEEGGGGPSGSERFNVEPLNPIEVGSLLEMLDESAATCELRRDIAA